MKKKLTLAIEVVVEDWSPDELIEAGCPLEEDISHYSNVENEEIEIATCLADALSLQSVVVEAFAGSALSVHVRSSKLLNASGEVQC